MGGGVFGRHFLIGAKATVETSTHFRVQVFEKGESVITIIFLIILGISGSHWDELHPGTTTFLILVGVAVFDLLIQLTLKSESEKIKRRP